MQTTDGAGFGYGGGDPPGSQPLHKNFLTYGSTVSVSCFVQRASETESGTTVSGNQRSYLMGKGFADVGLFLVREGDVHKASFRNCVFVV